MTHILEGLRIKGLYDHGFHGGTSSSSHSQVDDTSGDSSGTVNWRRILLLIIAITVHNIPGIIKDH